MFHTPSLSLREVEDLRRIRAVVRLGRVLRLGADQIVLERGAVPTDRSQVYVDCTATGFKLASALAIFESDCITLQQVRQSQPSLNAALVAFVEAHRDNDVDKNRLCPPNPYPDVPGDWIPWTLRGLHTDATWSDEPDLQSWLRASRLNLARGLHDHRSEPRIRSAFERLTNHHDAAIVNLEQLLEQRPALGPAWAA
jgi:hypothetical protein